MMQDTLLRVFVVAMSLLMYPRDDPGVEEWDDTTPMDMQKHEERLLRGADKPDHEMAPVREEVTRTDNKGSWDDVKNMIKKHNQSDQHAAEENTMSVSEDVTVAKQDSGELSADRSRSEPEAAPKASQTDHEQRREDIQTDGSFRDPSGPQGQQEKPEEKETFDSNEEESPLSHLHTKTSEKETLGKTIADREKDYLWYIWNTFSFISMIRLLRKYLGRTSQSKQEETRPFSVTCSAAQVPLPGNDTLQQFHSKCMQVSSNKKWREEFLEGFASDLLDAMRTVCDRHGGMVMDDFQMVDVCDIIVPFSPSDPYDFQCLYWNSQASDLVPGMQVCGQIKLVEKKVQSGCHCQSSDAEDMVCLLHCESEKVKTKTDVCGGLLCTKNSPFLSKSQVTRWFQSTIKQAWALISHKYDFDLNIRYIDAPGALVVRFRSGRKISFRMNPVVKFNTDAYFFITPCSPNNFDTFWTLSLTSYEERYLDHISKRLPGNSCHRQVLDIAYFLHRKQTALLGSSALKDFHFKTALMHLLLTTHPSQWSANYVACRLRDLLDFVEKSLEKKLLNHVLIGNPLITQVIALPSEFTQAEAVNLFHPLVVHNCIYRNAVMHFREVLKNAHVLIHDYVDQCTDTGSCFI